MPNKPQHNGENRAKTPRTLGILKSASTRLDPIRFAHTLGFSPDPRQTELLCCNSTSVILNCSRQWGKSTVMAIKAATERNSTLSTVESMREAYAKFYDVIFGSGDDNKTSKPKATKK